MSHARDAQHDDRNRIVERRVGQRAYDLTYASYGPAIYIDDSVIPIEPGGFTGLRGITLVTRLSGKLKLIPVA